jgi:hypothetical protein
MDGIGSVAMEFNAGFNCSFVNTSYIVPEFAGTL